MGSRGEKDWMIFILILEVWKEADDKTYCSFIKKLLFRLIVWFFLELISFGGNWYPQNWTERLCSTFPTGMLNCSAVSRTVSTNCGLVFPAAAPIVEEAPSRCWLSIPSCLPTFPRRRKVWLTWDVLMWRVCRSNLLPQTWPVLLQPLPFDGQTGTWLRPPWRCQQSQIQHCLHW